MLRTTYMRQLDTLREDLLRLGSMVEYALIHALHAFETLDIVAAQEIRRNDATIDANRKMVETQVIRLISAQISNEQDPRLLASAFAIAGELERIGDYAVSVARRTERIARQSAIATPPEAMRELAQLAKKMLNTSIESFLRQDLELAYSLRADEELADELEDQISSELIQMARDQPERLESILGMLDVVHALERIADRSTNIAGRVIYLTVNINEELNP